MVAFTFTATAVFAHQKETKKEETKQEAKKEQQQKEQNSDDLYCKVKKEDGSVVVCLFCNCAEVTKAALSGFKEI